VQIAHTVNGALGISGRRNGLHKVPGVGKIIGRYVATNAAEYEEFKARYYEQSGKKDDAPGEYVGYRLASSTRLESILAAGPRIQILKELDGYVRTVTITCSSARLGATIPT
jgi:hypothetical protein